jgi:hypothetical protein
MMAIRYTLANHDILNTQEEKKEEMENKKVRRKCARTEEGCTVKTVTNRTS